MDWAKILIDGVRAAIGAEAALFALVAIGLNVHFGYTGLLNFGQVGFVLVGAYGVAVTVSVFGAPLWLGFVVSVLLAVVLAFIFGIPTLRLRTDYLAITTLAVAEILRLVARSQPAEPLTGGVFGLTRFADTYYALNPFSAQSYRLGGLVLSKEFVWVSVGAWLLVAVSTLLVYLLMRSPWGRVVQGIREDEDAVRSLGKNVFVYKMQSLVIGGVIGALGGVVLAVNQQAVIPDTFLPQLTFFGYTVLILGGTARVFSPLAGTVVFWFIISAADSFVREAAGAGVLPPSWVTGQTIGAIRYILVGLGLMLLMIFRPQGIFGRREELLLDAR